MFANRTKMSGSLGSVVNTVKGDIKDILQSGNYYCTEEIARELSSINNAMEHLKLDDTLLQTSPEWRKSFNPAATIQHEGTAVNVLDKTAAYLYDYKNNFGLRNVERKQENEIREMHQWAMNNLIDLQRELDVNSLGAADRIRQFGDHIGVTDRYTGYRNNLTRGRREPFKLDTKWMDKSIKPGMYLSDMQRAYTVIGAGQETTRPRDITTQSYSGRGIRFGTEHPPGREFKGYRTIDSLYPRSTTQISGGAKPFSPTLQEVKTINALPAQAIPMQSSQKAVPRADIVMTMQKGPVTLSIQEQAGINTTFPGRTEYMTRFTSPPTDLPTTDFLINPRPNFLIHGRPLATARYEPSFTEYQTRYEWPDGNKIVKLPWLRK